MKPSFELVRAEAAGHIHLRRGDVPPQRLARLLQTLVAEFEGEVGHRRGHVHRPHRVPDHFRLLAHRNVRLIVFVGLRPVGGRIVAARERLFGEVVRLPATLVDEIGRKIEPPAVAGQAVELDQRQLDLLMSGIAAPLPGVSAESRGDMVDGAFHDVEEAPPPGRPEVGDRAFEQVAGVVEFVVVAQVRPALVGLALVVPAVEVAVGRLRPREIVDDRVNLGFDVLIAPVRQGVARRFDPLADVRVPEDLHGEAMRVARNGERGNGLRQLQRFEDADLLELGVLGRNRALEDCLDPLAPELAR